ncbi:PREDICTED: translation initiation factor IF-3, mitochondrial-like [Diuraphis noxia]|uniref:translation initiation factor IF-3, mitochondrial-like n=1 Tax=Diuraphis noxia TaxID=143948 RepID=UPI0007637920|nr:PREDICTED: translation initiation factor IF-3, mitochondrial-like [Diuraphis noxia]
MLKRFATSSLYAIRLPINWQPTSNVCLCRSLEFKKNRLEIDNEGALKKTRPKTVPLPKITLLGPEKDISVVTMDVASKMCERRGLKLVKIIDIDTKTQRPVYQMMTPNQFLKEDQKSHQKKDEKNHNQLKGEKTVLINCRIGQSDLESKVNNIRKWLSKMYEVRVTVTGDTANEVADEVIKMTQECSRVVQRREKGDSVKFQLLPPKKS